MSVNSRFVPRPEASRGGTAEDVARFFGYFDPPVDVGAIQLIVR